MGGGRTVDRIIHPLVHPIDLRAQLRRIQVELRLGRLGHERAELRVEHADDLRRLVVHDRVLLLVPQHGHREAPRVARVCAQVKVLHVLRVVQRVLVRAGEGVCGREGPAVRAHLRRDDGEGCVSKYAGGRVGAF